MGNFNKKNKLFYLYSIVIIIVILLFLVLIYKKINPIPDLVFYYSDDKTISNYSNLKFGSSLILNISGNITDKSITNKNSNIIGYFTEYKMCNPINNNSAYVTNIETFHLKNGCIIIQPAGIQPLNFQGNYSIGANTTQTFSIVNGTEIYLYKKGYVTLKTYDNLERKVSIYFV